MKTVVRHAEFDRSLKRMFALGGQRKKRAEKVAGILETLNLAGIESIRNFPLTNHGESRIKHCVKLDLNDGYRVITVQNDKFLWFLFVGDHDECEHWLTQHAGIELGYDKSQKIWEPIYRSGDSGVVIARAPKPSDRPLLERLPEHLLSELLDSLPPIKAFKIGRLAGTVTLNEIQVICSDISGDGKRTLIQDVLIFLANGDRDSAEKRIDEFVGRAVLAEQRPDSEIITIRDGDVVRRLMIGSAEYERWLNRFASDGDHLEWLLFMHPDQEAVVDEEFGGPAQLSGVSGSGKTCIAVRRALRLVEASDDSRVLLVTLNRSLAGLLRKLVSAAAVNQLVKERVVVTSFFELCQELLVIFEPRRSRYYDSVTWKLNEHIDEIFREFYRCWTNSREASVLEPVHASLMAQGINAEHYVREEFDWLRSAIGETDRDKYLSAQEVPRVGRRFRLQESWRKLILDGLAAWERKMEAVGVIDYLGLTTAVSRHMDRIESRYTSIIIDEAQDFGTTELAILRRLVSDGDNDIFLCGDIAQQVLPKHRVLSQAGIHIGSRSRRIIKNYRNTREILEAAYHVLIQNLSEEMFEQAEKDLEILDPKYANRSSNAPLVLRGCDLAEEIAYARSVVASHLLLQPRAKCCIAVAGFSLCEVERFAARLGLRALDGTHDPLAVDLVMSDLEQMKGYEFDLVVVVNCRNGILPPSDAPRDEVYRDGCRLYVAMTRAKIDLYISYSGEPSTWLKNAIDKLTFADWCDVEELQREYLTDGPEHLAEVEDQNEGDELQLDGRQFCYTHRAIGLSVEGQNKLCELIDGRGRLLSGQGRIRWKSVAEALSDIQVRPVARKQFGPAVVSAIQAHFGFTGESVR